MAAFFFAGLLDADLAADFALAVVGFTDLAFAAAALAAAFFLVVFDLVPDLSSPNADAQFWLYFSDAPLRKIVTIFGLHNKVSGRHVLIDANS